MIVIGIILSFVSLGFLCWLLFALAVQALPVFVALAAGLAAYHSGSGEIGGFVVGLIAGALTLAAGQIAVAAFRSPLIRTAIALVFAVPATMAGYHAALGLAQLGVPAELWQRAFALFGAVAVKGCEGDGLQGLLRDESACSRGDRTADPAHQLGVRLGLLMVLYLFSF
jgi:hypothetical protein